MRTLAIAAIKGGTGKTTTAAALAQAAVKDGRKVLAVDLDPQANLSYVIGADQNRRGAYHLLTGTPAGELLQDTAQGIAVISGSPDLSTIQTAPGSGRRLREALEPVREEYDICIIDTPPTFGELIYNALYAADALLIPLEADTNSLQGLYQITDIAGQIKKGNAGLQIAGTVITRYDGRAKFNRYLKDVIAEKGAASGAPLITVIRAGISVREAAAMQESLFDYAPASKPAADYMELYRAIF